ncbi:protein transport protein Sec16B-like [Clupea harengus]|uniref:Protein transport protein Sec16B-like n=1 Tax=Clupea harengus TaxID=7950 RepID=A0A6P8FK53_CLUHA|nr:protein transport protein Sec16B-like [Clupea harengus]XP_031428650.1 protein transport protein Sec16B-like [Clupea harengus]
MTLQMEPGKNARLVLVGGDLSLPLEEFACNRAIEQTELYEYCLSLSRNGLYLLNFQMFKILYARRLFGAGHFAEALKYAEAIGRAFLVSASVNQRVLSNLLKLCAILPPKMQGEWTEPPWMTSLKRLGKDLGLDDPTEPQQGLESPNQPQHVEALGTAHSSGGVEVVPLGTAHSSGLEVPRASPAEKDIPPALPQGQPEAQSVEPREVVSSPAASTSHVSPVKLETQKIDHLKEEKQEIEDKQDRFSILTVVHDNLRHSEEDISSACPNDPGNNRRLHKKSSAKKRFLTACFGCRSRAED